MDGGGEPGHEHHDNLDDALHAAYLIATGKARACFEYRNGFLAASWFEYEVNSDEFEMGSIALMLSPFDRDEWEILDTDVWKQVRVTRTLRNSGVLTLEEFEVLGNPPVHANNVLHDWLRNGLGDPNRGLKWATSFGGAIVVQVPAGWRVISDRQSEHTDWSPPDSEMLLRVVSFWRDAQAPHPTRTTSGAKPISVLHETPNDAPGYIQDRWTLMFGDADQEFMVMVRLYSKAGGEAFHNLIRDQIAGAIDKTIYVPSTVKWDTKTVD